MFARSGFTYGSILWNDFLFNCEDSPVDHDNLPNKLFCSLFTRRLYIQDTKFSLLLRASQSACLLIYKALYKLIIMVGGMGLLDFSSFHSLVIYRREFVNSSN